MKEDESGIFIYSDMEARNTSLDKILMFSTHDRIDMKWKLKLTN